MLKISFERDHKNTFRCSKAPARLDILEKVRANINPTNYKPEMMLWYQQGLYSDTHIFRSVDKNIILHL